MKVCIIYSDSGRGLAKDANIIVDILSKAGFIVNTRLMPQKLQVKSRIYVALEKVFHRFDSKLLDRFLCFIERSIYCFIYKFEFDVNIHLESIFKTCLNAAKHNILIPNQEWFKPEWRRNLCHMSIVLCKTRAAENCFKVFNRCPVDYIGFTSHHAGQLDSLLGNEILHLAGRSSLKGTAAVLRVWMQHPDWPVLHVVCDKYIGPKVSNINYIYSPCDKVLEEIKLRCQIVLAPSEAEGFGHSIVENMARGAVVITTDAPPMNELIQLGRGFLVTWNSSNRHRMGMCYKVDDNELELMLLKVLSMSKSDLFSIGFAARNWYLDQHALFEKRVIEKLSKLSKSR